MRLWKAQITACKVFRVEPVQMDWQNVYLIRGVCYLGVLSPFTGVYWA